MSINLFGVGHANRYSCFKVGIASVNFLKVFHLNRRVSCVLHVPIDPCFFGAKEYIASEVKFNNGLCMIL